MHRIGFDSDQYIEMQSRHIAQRRSEFGGKLYLEFGGKLIDDMHASRVLPGFTPDNKVRMLRELADEVEIIVAVNAKDFARRKVRADMGTTYDDEVLRQIRLTLCKIIAHEGEVFGASSRECGNYRNLSLDAAKTEARRYLAELDARPVTFIYEE